jgi:cyclic lactone autoinducer peptide
MKKKSLFIKILVLVSALTTYIAVISATASLSCWLGLFYEPKRPKKLIK